MARMHGNKSKYLIDQDRKYYNYVVIGFFAFSIFSVIWLIFYFKYFLTLSILVRNILVILEIIIILIAAKIIKKFEIHSDNFFHGRSGEGAIWYELRDKLPDTYSCFQSAHFPGETWDIDFVVIGPTGIFTIEVKSHWGKIDFIGGQLTRRGWPFKEKDILYQAVSQARGLRTYLNLRNISIHPILVFSSSLAIIRLGKKLIKNVQVIKKGWLVDIIESKQDILSEEQIQEIGKILMPLVKN